MYKVTVITPTTHSRKAWNDRVPKIIEAQDYPDIEWLVCYDDVPIGMKRNSLVAAATGDIICHVDSDDYYSPDWITKSVEALVNSNAELTGLSSAYFAKNGKLLDYTYTGKMPYVCGATMCYWRSTWEKRKFKDINSGEDTMFCEGRKVFAHDYKTGFLANLHDNNTASGKNMRIFTPTNMLIGDIYPKFLG